MNFTEVNRSLRLAAIVCLSIALFAGLQSGAVTTFVHPRTCVLLEIAAGILVIMSLFSLKVFMKTAVNQTLDYRNVLMLAPVILVIAVNPTGLSSRIAAQKGLLTFSRNNPGKPVNMPAGNDNNSNSVNQLPHENSNKGKTSEQSTAAFHNSMSVDTIADSVLYRYLYTMHNDRKQFRGKTVMLKGFVVADTTLGRNSFFIARMLISCCAADAAPAGLYCITDKNFDIRENDWIELKGVVGYQQISLPWNNDKEVIPVLTVTEVTACKKPRVEYIYPDY